MIESMIREIKSFDDGVSGADRKNILELEGMNSRCPYLDRAEGFFYYCGMGLGTRDKKPSLFNPIYCRHVSINEMRVHCFGVYNRCCYFVNGLRLDVI